MRGAEWIQPVGGIGIVAWLVLASCTTPKSSSRPTEGTSVRPLAETAPLETIVLSNDSSPILTFKLVFRAGSIDDPKGKEGLTDLTAEVMVHGGTGKLSSAELIRVLFPMAAELSVTTEKELTVFTGRVHRDHLNRFLEIFTDVLLDPRFDPKEFDRLKSNSLSEIRNRLRGEDDETLGKVALDALIYPDHPYRHAVGGTVQGLTAITLADVQAHAKNVFTQDRLIIGVAGPVEPPLLAKLKERLGALPKTSIPRPALPPPPEVFGKVLIIAKDSLSTAISSGYAYSLRRGDADYFPTAFALSYLGEHRQLNGVLFQELREKRGLNYGDYAYPEHFVQEGEGTYPQTNQVRAEQDFSIWLRPVEPQNAVFAAKGAVYFLGRLLDGQLPPDRLELTRGFLNGYTRLWEQTDARRLGYAIDDRLYGTSHFLDAYRRAIASLTPQAVVEAARRHLHPARLNWVFVTGDPQKLKDSLLAKEPTTIQYPSPKPPEVLALDQEIGRVDLKIDPKEIRIIPVDEVMER